MGMSQELAATVEYMATLPHDQIARFVDEPIRSTAAMIERLRAEREALARQLLKPPRGS